MKYYVTEVTRYVEPVNDKLRNMVFIIMKMKFLLEQHIIQKWVLL